MSYRGGDLTKSAIIVIETNEQSRTFSKTRNRDRNVFQSNFFLQYNQTVLFRVLITVNSDNP